MTTFMSVSDMGTLVVAIDVIEDMHLLTCLRRAFPMLRFGSIFINLSLILCECVREEFLLVFKPCPALAILSILYCSSLLSEEAMHGGPT